MLQHILLATSFVLAGAVAPAFAAAIRPGRLTTRTTMRRIPVAAIALVLLAAAVHAQDVPSVTLPAELARVLTDYEAAWQRKDARALAALFTEDGWVLSNGRPAVQGRAAIEAHYRNQGGPLSLRAFAYSTDGATGYIIGGYARQQGEPDIGKFTLTLRRFSNGRWLILSDMDNGNRRP